MGKTDRFMEGIRRSRTEENKGITEEPFFLKASKETESTVLVSALSVNKCFFSFFFLEFYSIRLLSCCCLEHIIFL